MDIKSIIKNAIANKLDEHKIVEVDNTPQVNSTSDYVKYLAEAVKFRIEELSKDTLQSYQAKASTQTKGPKGDNREKGIIKAKAKVARKEMGLDRDNPTHNRERNLSTHQGQGSPQGREPSPEQKANAAANRKPSMPLNKIHGMGVGGKPHSAPSLKKAGVTKDKVLAAKSEKIAAGGDKLLRKIGRSKNK